MLKLLVGPLYSNKKEVAIRELVQNAVDAVRELDQLIASNDIQDVKDRWAISGEVNVEFLCGEDDEKIYEVKITDRGTGMTLPVIRDYFLTAGASLRKSDAWKKLFEDEQGSSKIQRSGRFGIGALSAFLLGSKIAVKTRHYSQPEDAGLEFEASLDTAAIDIKRISCPIGTEIRISIPENLQKTVAKILPGRYSRGISFYDNPSGYFYRYPNCLIFSQSREIKRDERDFLPNPSDSFTADWNYFECEGFQVHWNTTPRYPSISVNGIEVVYGYRYSDTQLSFSPNYLEFPNLSISDRDGLFPINLQRNAVASRKVPFENELVNEIVDGLVCDALFQLKLSGSIPKTFRPFKTNTEGLNSIWLHCGKGFVLFEPLLVEAYAPNHLFVFFGNGEIENVWQTLHSTIDVRYIGCQMRLPEVWENKVKLKGKFRDAMLGEIPEFIKVNSTGYSMMVSNDFITQILDQTNPGKAIRKQIGAFEASPINGWKSSQSSNFNQRALPFEAIIEDLGEQHKQFVIGEYEFANLDGNNGPKSDGKQIFDRWMDICGIPYLPTDNHELARLEKRVRDKIGDKYEIWRKRFDEAVKKRVDK